MTKIYYAYIPGNSVSRKYEKVTFLYEFVFVTAQLHIRSSAGWGPYIFVIEYSSNFDNFGRK